MIFTGKMWQQVLDGTKTQTRRLVKTGDYHSRIESEGRLIIGKVYDVHSRLRWMVGRTYAVQPGRGQKAVGRIRITEIRRERLQDIASSNCMAEGIEMIPNQWGTPWYRCIGGEWKASREAFAELWNSINKRAGDRWADNPEVWALTFELVG